MHFQYVRKFNNVKSIEMRDESDNESKTFKLASAQYWELI